ncbi:beta-eliminating lyase-related protein, partial [Amylibacter sp.]|nr:beta-eliminating lyase-related protein [Amylibacter sp.]
ALDCTPAELTWKSGIDVVSFGATKNGCLGVEAVVFFDPEMAWEFELRRKRGGHLLSKHRMLSAQMEGYLKDDLWIDLARKANSECQKLLSQIEKNPNIKIIHPPEANLIFATIPTKLHDKLIFNGARYNHWSRQMSPLDVPENETKIRLACSWCTTGLEINKLLELFNY